MSCCISQLLIFASDSSLILVKEYRKNVAGNNKDVIIKEIMEEDTEFHKPYLIIKNKIHCFAIRRENVYFCATTTSESDEINILEILTRFADIVQDFCGMVNEKVVRSNIVLIYEILEEFLVDGYIQVDSTEKMKPLIFSEQNITNSAKSHSWDMLGFNSELDLLVPSHASNQPIVRQRTEHPTTSRKNEIFLDFLETLSVTIENDGTPSKKQLIGRLVIKCFLSGSHSLRIGFDSLGPLSPASFDLSNDQDGEMTYHESVRKCGDKRSISFQAPDREMTVMRFKVEGESVKSIPFVFSHDIFPATNSARDLNLHLKMVTNLPSPNAEVSKVVVSIPVPKSTTSITQNLSGSFQSAHLDEGGKQLTWTLRKIPDKFEIQADFRLINAIGTSSSELEARSSIGPAALDFEIAGHTASGMKISSLVVEDSSDSRTRRWIRYILSSDSYTIKF